MTSWVASSRCCHGCRRCTPFCRTFPTLFDTLDHHAPPAPDPLTAAEQDRIVDECFQCKLCFLNCPFGPDQSELAIDFPRLMLRAVAMRRHAKEVSTRRRLTDAVFGRTDLVGKVSTAVAPAANALTGAPGGVLRKVVAATAGVSEQRLLPPFARQRFTTWFKRRPRVRMGRPQARVTVFPTCLVEYQAPSIGYDLVRVYERNGIECTVKYPGCCGEPSLHSGDIARFRKEAARNVAALAQSVRAGHEVVVPQPTCAYVLRHDYVDYVGGPDAPLVAEHTVDASELLMRVHNGEDTTLDTAFHGDVPASITYHAPCHLRAQDIGSKSRDLLKLTGAHVQVVQQCSGIDGMWGLRHDNAERSLPVSRRLGELVTTAGGEVVAGDCHLANTAITEQTGRLPVHPIQVIARAYGIPEDV